MPAPKTPACPECGAWTEVLRTTTHQNIRWRVYVCANLHRFRTETVETIVPMGQKRNGMTQRLASEADT